MSPAEVAEFLTKVAPELAGCYIVFHGDLPRPLNWPKMFFGATAPSMDLTLKPYLCWRGRAPCILLNDHLLGEEVAEQVANGFDRAEAERWSFLRAALHEAAHILSRQPPYYRETEDAPPAELVLLLLHNPDVESYSPPDGLPQHGHSLVWMRVLSHLTYRARRRGVRLSALAVAGDDWQLSGKSHPNVYAQTLTREVRRMRHWP